MPTQITPLPTPPSRQDPANFSTRADSFLGALPTFGDEANTLAAEVNQNAIDAEASASLAAASAVSATATAGTSVWISGTSYTAGQVRYSPITFLSYRRKTNGAGTTDPSLDSTNWVLVAGSGNVRSSNSPSAAGEVLIANAPGTDPSWKELNTGTASADLKQIVSTYLTLPVGFGNVTIRNFKSVNLGLGKELIIFSGDINVQAVVYDGTTNSFGPVTIVRGSVSSPTFAAELSSANTVLICYTNSTIIETVVLTITGTSITVGTAVSTTLGSLTSILSNDNTLLKVGSSFIIEYYHTSAQRLRAITVSGTTPTISAELTLPGTGGSASNHVVDSSRLICFTLSTTLLYAQPVSVSGTTLTLGTAATATANSQGNIASFKFNSERYGVVYLNSNFFGSVVTLNNTTATLTSADLGFNDGSPVAFVVNNQAIVKGVSTSAVTVLTDDNGTAVAGVAIALPANCNAFGYTSNSLLVNYRLSSSTSLGKFLVVSIAGNNPVLSFECTTTYGTEVVQHLNAMQSGIPRLARNVLRTESGKHCCLFVSSEDSKVFTLAVSEGSSAKLIWNQPSPTTAILGTCKSTSDASAWCIGVMSGFTKINISKVELV